MRSKRFARELGVMVLGLGIVAGLVSGAIYAQGPIDIKPSDTAPFVDTRVLIKGSADGTKGVLIEADGLTTATNRKIIMPDWDVNLGLFPANGSPLTASRLVVSNSSGVLASNGALTSGCIPLSTSSGASLSCSTASESGTTVTFSGSTTHGRQFVSGFAPTCAQTSGANTTAAIASGSSDLAGACVVTCGTSCSTAGSITLTFSAAYGGSFPICILTGNPGTASWGPGSTFAVTTASTTAPVFGWDNANAAGTATALTNGATYAIGYFCIGRP